MSNLTSEKFSSTRWATISECSDSARHLTGSKMSTVLILSAALIAMLAPSSCSAAGTTNTAGTGSSQQTGNSDSTKTQDYSGEWSATATNSPLMGYDLKLGDDGSASGVEYDNANATTSSSTYTGNWKVENGNLKITWTHYSFIMNDSENPVR